MEIMGNTTGKSFTFNLIQFLGWKGTMVDLQYFQVVVNVNGKVRWSWHGEGLGLLLFLSFELAPAPASAA